MTELQRIFCSKKSICSFVYFRGCAKIVLSKPSQSWYWSIVFHWESFSCNSESSRVPLKRTRERFLSSSVMAWNETCVAVNLDTNSCCSSTAFINFYPQSRLYRWLRRSLPTRAVQPSLQYWRWTGVMGPFLTFWSLFSAISTPTFAIKNYQIVIFLQN